MNNTPQISGTYQTFGQITAISTELNWTRYMDGGSVENEQ